MMLPLRQKWKNCNILMESRWQNRFHNRCFCIQFYLNLNKLCIKKYANQVLSRERLNKLKIVWGDKNSRLRQKYLKRDRRIIRYSNKKWLKEKENCCKRTIKKINNFKVSFHIVSIKFLQSKNFHQHKA